MVHINVQHSQTMTDTHQNNLYQTILHNNHALSDQCSLKVVVVLKCRDIIIWQIPEYRSSVTVKSSTCYIDTE